MNNFLSKVNVFILISCLAFFSCSNNDSPSDKNGENGPTNLVVSAVVVGTDGEHPNGDGTGVVNFNINATNATSYKILLGNGEIKEVTNGAFSYTYKTSGTHTYIVYVSAYNGSQFISTSLTVTIFVGSTANLGLVWSDEFDKNGAPDSSKWTYEINGDGGGNNEEQYYTDRPENSTVENGVLKIFTKKEAYKGKNYTSARLVTKGKYSTKYGKIEFRAKLPVGKGTWPALWMLGDNIDTTPWPACGEIDVMEMVGKAPDVIYGTLHYPGRSGGNADGKTVKILNSQSEFHIYTAEWTPESIIISVDNIPFYNFKNSASTAFNQKFFIIINCAIGGNFGGPEIDPNFTSSTFEIDYVRVYN